MTKLWIIVADSSQTKIFFSDDNIKTIHEIKTLTSPEARLHEKDLSSDYPGRTFDSKGAGRHSMQKSVTAKEQKAIEFSTQIAAEIEHAHNLNQFDQLIIVSPPKFLGLLKMKLDNTVVKCIKHILTKNLTKLKTDTIRKRVAESEKYP